MYGRVRTAGREQPEQPDSEPTLEQPWRGERGGAPVDGQCQEAEAPLRLDRSRRRGAGRARRRRRGSTPVEAPCARQPRRAGRGTRRAALRPGRATGSFRRAPAGALIACNGPRRRNERPQSCSAWPHANASPRSHWRYRRKLASAAGPARTAAIAPPRLPGSRVARRRQAIAANGIVRSSPSGRVSTASAGKGGSGRASGRRARRVPRATTSASRTLSG